MNYTISSFRSNMGEILDQTKFQRKITIIGRRNKKEFVILPVEILENIDYKTILSKLEEDNYDNESMYAAKGYIENTKEDNIDWQKYIIN